MLGASRVIVMVFCVAFVVFGLYLAISVPGEGGLFAALFLVPIGVAGIVAIAFERMRYRAEANEPPRPSSDPSRAGGDPPGTRFPPGFQRTDEVFIDASTGVTMRVWYDPGSGERRYVAETGPGGAGRA